MVGERSGLDRAARRRGALPALLVSAAALVVMVVQSVIGSALDTGMIANRVSADAAAATFGGSLAAGLIAAAPFAVGVFLSLWQLAPIGGELRLAHVVTRSLLATLAGTLVSVLVVVLVSLVTAVAGLPALFAGAADPGGRFLSDVLLGVLSALGTAVWDAPLVTLASILLWGWLQRHPREHTVLGGVDEL